LTFPLRLNAVQINRQFNRKKASKKKSLIAHREFRFGSATQSLKKSSLIQLKPSFTISLPSATDFYLLFGEEKGGGGGKKP
jgi:hypothetical protein